jgi:hypothetical protein
MARATNTHGRNEKCIEIVFGNVEREDINL